MNQFPLVSILINNYNYESYVSQAIESALNQTYDRVEVVVVDDGSKDNSRKVIEQYGDRIVSVFKQNGGQGSAFNAGFAASQGNLICFLDADDYCFPEKASQIAKAFQDDPELGWVFHRLKRVDAEGEALDSSGGMNEFGRFDFRSQILNGQAVRPIFPATSGLCFQREVLRQILPVPEQLRISADNFLRLSAIHLTPGLLIDSELAVHRIHGSNSYESRKDTAYLHAETNIQTSYHLRQQFPETKAFTDQLFSHSYGQIAGRSGFNRLAKIPESNAYLKEYFSLASWISYSPKIAYNYAKSFLKR